MISLASQSHHTWMTKLALTLLRWVLWPKIAWDDSKAAGTGPTYRGGVMQLIWFCVCLIGFVAWRYVARLLDFNQGVGWVLGAYFVFGAVFFLYQQICLRSGLRGR